MLIGAADIAAAWPTYTPGVDSDFPPSRAETLTTVVDVVRGEGSDRRADRRPGPSPELVRTLPPGDARLTGRRLEDRYEILRVLDRGGMATVYVALDHRLDREVAVKVMHPAFAHDPAFVDRFRREAKAAASIRHRNVVAVTDAGSDTAGGDVVVFLVMELVRGRTLRALLHERGRLSPAQALEITEPILAALDAAHTAGLMHRDVKPENVLLGDDGTVLVADFGLARAVEASALTTHAGLLMGTVAYVSPEQVARGTADARSDVYAAGIVLFEMLTGGVPYEAETPVAVAYRHVHEQVPPPSSVASDVPAECDELVRTATAADPIDRYVDAGAFLAAVRQARRSTALRAPRGGEAWTVALPAFGTSGPVVPAKAATAGTRPAPHATAVLDATVVRPTPGPDEGRRRRRWPWVLLVVVLLSVGGGFGGWWLARDAKTHVPSLLDRNLAAYEASLAARHLTWTVGAATHSDTLAAGLVVTTSPPPGSAVTPHSVVIIETSAGILRLAVPAVAGRTQTAAAAVLTGAGFPPPHSHPAYSDTVPAGEVISTVPAPAALVDHRTVVALAVSSGPAPVEIPDETGQSQADATKTLTSLGLKVAVVSAFSDTVPPGSVVAAVPSAGAGHRGDTVTLTVSMGPLLVAVPDLVGEDGSHAAAELRSVGLVPREVALFGIHGGQVVTQSPRGGKVKPGSTVTYYTAY